MSAKLRVSGIGLRTPHLTEFLEKKPGVAWVEVHAENYFVQGGRPLANLEKVREDYPISLHGVSLSLGSTDDINWQHLTQLRDLSKQIDACLVSDHLSWSSYNGQYFHDLLPLIYTDEALSHVVERIKVVQDFLGRQIILENISQYVSYPQSTMLEWDFFKEVVTQSGCGILLDLTNIHITAMNLDFNPMHYLSALPADAIQEIHLSGFTSVQNGSQELLIDTHNTPILPAIWDLFRQALRLYGIKPVMIEWDKDLPTLDKLCLEAYRAETIIKENYVATKRTG